MIATEPIGLVNTGLPVAGLVVTAIVLPRLAVPTDTRSHYAIAGSVLATAAVLLAAGAVVFASVYAIGSADITNAVATHPYTTTLFFVRLSAMAALVWIPVLALVWFTMAQAVEVRLGEDIARGLR